MNVFYEERGTFKVATILSSNVTSLQVEAPHGKRSKIKTNSVLLKFDKPSLSEFMDHAKKVADELDLNFLWECSECNEEFISDTLATEYFGYSPSPVESAAVLIKLHSAPMYFYKKGKGCYKAAPPNALKAALASQKKKRLEAEQKIRYVRLLETFTLPEEFNLLLPDLLYKPDKSKIEWKALDEACVSSNLSLPNLLDKCGAIPSTHDYHLNRFLLKHFPKGEGFDVLDTSIKLNNPADLPIADVKAFSIDDASTTEIDDAFSVTRLSLGGFRIGIHIAAPALGIIPGSPLDKLAAQRLSTVYLPGKKITMLPETTIQHYTLGEGRLCPALSMYLDVSDNFTITTTHSCIEQVKISANLRNDTLIEHFNESTVERNVLNYSFGQELITLLSLARKMEAFRGKANDSNNEKIDYRFSIKEGNVTIIERRRDSPIDKLVSELMIFVNAEWGKKLANNNVTGIYRNQSGGKVTMSTSPAQHQGLGIVQYAWFSSPMRRYVDLINQRQLIALLRREQPPYSKGCSSLLSSISEFEETYEAYNEFQRIMERYWCLRWLLQEKIRTIGALVIKENFVKLDHLPLVIKVPSLPVIFPETHVQVEILLVDLFDLSVNAKFIRKLEI